jgi:hypothetical protein
MRLFSAVSQALGVLGTLAELDIAATHNLVKLIIINKLRLLPLIIKYYNFELQGFAASGRAFT